MNLRSILLAVAVLLVASQCCTPVRQFGPSAAGKELPSYETTPILRVGLHRSLESCSITASGSYRVESHGDVNKSHACSPSESWKLASGEGKVSALCSDGEMVAVSDGAIRFIPEGETTLSVEGKAYRGDLEVFWNDGGIAVANIVDMESYLRGVVPREIGYLRLHEIEAVKAQAVAARTYALRFVGKRVGKGFDLYASTSDQVYEGVSAEDDVADLAIRETAGTVIVHGDSLIQAYFSACCGGRTAFRDELWKRPGVPYLRSVWDTPGRVSVRDKAFCKKATLFDWERKWIGKELNDVLARWLLRYCEDPHPSKTGEFRNMKVSKRGKSGRALEVEIETTTGKFRLVGDNSRYVLRRSASKGGILLSTFFDVRLSGSPGPSQEIVVAGRGFGHGVGLCQEGAIGMAREGYNYQDIVKHYYSGIRLVRLYGPAG